jgi:hypothetical protein
MPTAEMDRLGIGENPVEVEENGIKTGGQFYISAHKLNSISCCAERSSPS